MTSPAPISRPLSPVRIVTRTELLHVVDSFLENSSIDSTAIPTIVIQPARDAALSPTGESLLSLQFEIRYFPCPFVHGWELAVGMALC